MQDTTTEQNDFGIAALACALIAVVWSVIGDPLAPVALAAAPLVLLVAVRKPFELCLIFIAFSFFRLHEAFPEAYPLKIPLIIGGLCLFALAWHVAIQRSIEPVWPAELKWFTFMFCWTTLSVLFAANRSLSIMYWTDVLSKIGIMTFAIAWLMRGPVGITQANRMIVISSGLICLVAIHNWISGVGLVSGGRVTIGRELNSELGDPNDLALALLLPLAFAIMSVIQRTGWVNRMLGLIITPAILWCIVATQSRGGLIGVMAVLATICLSTIKSKGSILALAVSFIVVLSLATNIAERPDLGDSAGGLDASALDRLYAWRAAINMVMDRPAYGVGLANFSESMYFYSEHWPNYRDMVAHSTWLTVLAETGIPGFIAFIGMVAAMFISINRSIAKLQNADAPPITVSMAVALLASLAGFCAAGTFLTQAFTWQVYILLALTVGIGRYADEAAAAAGSEAVARYRDSADKQREPRASARS